MVEEVSVERMMEIVGRAHRLKCKELGPVYIAVSLMRESKATPEEVVKYIEENFMEEVS